MLLEKLYYLDAYSPHVYTVCGIKIRLRLVQLNLVSLGTKENYKEGKELLLAIVLVCKLSCSFKKVDRKLKCVVRNVILSIDPHFIVVVH